MPKAIPEWNFDVQVVNAKTGKALSRKIVEAWDKDYANRKNGNDLLWAATTDDNGKCKGRCTKASFQDLAIRHLDKGRPDVYFVVKDLLGQVLLITDVKTNLKPGLHVFQLRANPTPKSLPANPVANRDWTILGEVMPQTKGVRYLIQCFDKDTSNTFGQDDWIFTTTTDLKGRFEHIFFDWSFRFKAHEKEREPDLYFVVHDLKGQLIYISDVYTNLKPDWVYSVQLDIKQRTTSMAALAKNHVTINWAKKIANPKIIKFPVKLRTFNTFLASTGTKALTPPIRLPILTKAYIFGPPLPVRPVWEFNIKTVGLASGKPLSGLKVEAWDKDYSKKKIQNDLLWVATTDVNGQCHGICCKGDFQDLRLRHFDRGKPDVFFIIKDRWGSILYRSKIYHNLKAGKRNYILKIDTKPKAMPVSRAKKPAYWNIQADVVSQLNAPFIVECYDKEFDKRFGPDDLVFVETTDRNRHIQHRFYSWQFRFKKNEKEKKPDVYFVVKDLSGNPLFVSQVFSNLKKSAKNEAYYFLIDLNTRTITMKTVATQVGTPIVMNQPPQIQILPPTGQLLQGENIEIKYRLIDIEADLTHIEVEYSIDNGTSFHIATEATHAASEGTANLRSSAVGIEHTFIWHAKNDLANLPATSVLLRIQSYDTQKGGSDITAPFTIGVKTSNHPPQVTILSPQTNVEQAAIVELKYELKDDNSDPIRIEVTYSTDSGLTFQTATEAFGYGSEGLDNLSSSPTGNTHPFFWNADTDLPIVPAKDIMLQIQAFGSAPGGIASVGPFDINTNYPPMIQIFSPMANSPQGSPVEIQYVLTDKEGQICDLDAYYSIDKGETFLPATSDNSGDGKSQLSSSQYGEVKIFMWDAAKDLSSPTQPDVMFKIQPRDQNAGGISFSPLFHVTLPQAPAVRILQPTSSTWGTPLPILYLLSHPSGNQQLSVEITFSIDGGKTYTATTEAQNIASEGLTKLRATKDGTKHFFAWDAEKDISSLDKNVEKDVIIRIQAFRNTEMGEGISDAFSLDSGYIGIPPLHPGTVTKRPTIHVFDPPDHEGIHVEARFLVKHEDNARVNIRAEYSVNGGAYHNATPAPSSDQLTNLAAPHVNADYCFIWDAARDFQKQQIKSASVTLRLTPYIGPDDGTAYVTKTFNVNIKQPDPVKKPVPKTPLNSLILEKMKGDDQVVLAGMLPREDITVLVLNAKKVPVRHARLTFSFEGPPAIKPSFESHPTLRTTTDYYGRAGIRLRTKPGIRGDFKIRAQVVGVPAASTTFLLKSRVAKIIPSSTNPQGPFEYGQVYSFYFYLDSGEDLLLEDFFADEYDPIQLKVATHNAEASNDIYYLPGSEAYTRQKNIFRVDITPSSVSGTSATTNHFSFKIGALNVQGVSGYDSINFPIVANSNAEHLLGVRVHDNGYGAAESVYQPLRLYMEVASGHDPKDPVKSVPQRAFPGLTLATPFKVKITDGTKKITQPGGKEETIPYKQAIDYGEEDVCGKTRVKNDLKIEWYAHNGVISSTKGKGTKSILKLSPDNAIYFTPTNRGPWYVEAGFSGYVYDFRSEERDYFVKERTAPGSSDYIARKYCKYKPGLAVNLSKRFYIHLPESIGFENIAKAIPNKPGPLLEQVKAGIDTRLLVTGLSPFVNSTGVDEIELSSVLLDGKDVPNYKGTALTYKQKFQLRKVNNIEGVLRSADFLIQQHEQKGFTGKAHAIIPLSHIHASVFNIKFAIKTAGLRRQRLMIKHGTLANDIETPFESPVGTSAYGGALKTVTIHNGEFIYSGTDLSFPSRAGDVAVSRTYRSQIGSLLDPDNDFEMQEPLGPGWFLGTAAYLEVCHQHLRYWDETGAYYDYPYQYAGRGQFIFITKNLTIDKDRSAIEIRDRHRNTYHFNSDGSMRFYVDRFGNKFAYDYNEKAQLTKISDCLIPDKRNFLILYYADNKSNKDKKWRNKIKEIIDFWNRKISFEYYKEGDFKGLLQKLTFPECETLLEGSASPKINHRSYEYYDYVKDSKLGVCLKSIRSLDSKGLEKTLFTNYYSAGRITKQKQGNGDFTFEVLSTNTLQYKNKSGSLSKLTFPDSPFWDAAAPTEIIDPEKYSTKMSHNHDGHLSLLTPPQGGHTEYIYDEDSPYERSHADLLAVVQTSEKGKKRISTNSYSGKYHFVTKAIGSEGNVPGADPELHAVFYNYDYHRGTGKAGNVVDSHGPRTLNMVYKPLANDKRQPTWIDENPEHEYIYNKNGQLTAHIDERGVKTEYFYYAAGNPTGGSVGPDGGGFLAQIRYDTQITSKRDIHLPGDDAKPQSRKLTFVYDTLGHIIETIDQDGIKTTYKNNKLGDVIETVYGPGVSGLNIKSESFYGPNGEVIRTKNEHPGTSSATAQKSVQEFTYKPDGNVFTQSTKINNNKKITETYLYDKGNRLTKRTNDLTSDTESFKFDKRSFVTENTVTSGGLTLTSKNKYTANGSLKEVTAPSGNKTTYEQDEFGDTNKSTDPFGVTSETLLDDAGVARVSVRRPGGTGTSDAIEFVRNNYGQIRRSHHLRFNRKAGSKGRALPKVPENLGGVDPASYLPNSGKALPDTGISPDDGRTLHDVVYGVGGNPIRSLDDTGGIGQARYDAYDRSLERDDRHGNRYNTRFNDTAREAEASYTAESDDPLAPEKHTYRLKKKADLAGRITQDADHMGRTFRYEHDDAGRLVELTDAMADLSAQTYDGTSTSAKLNKPGNKTTFHYDAYDRLVRAETHLTKSGKGGGQPDTSNPYNPTGKIIEEVKYDDKGRFIEERDMAGFITKFHYKGDSDLLEKVEFPGSIGSGGTYDNPKSGSPTFDTFTYDASGRIETITDANGTKWRYTYNKGLLQELAIVKKGQDIKGTTGYAYNYDDDGNLAEVIDKSDPKNKMEFSADSQGNILEQKFSDQTVKTDTDGEGRITKLTYPSGEEIEYEYDNKTGLLKTIKNKDGVISRFNYLGNDRVKSYTTGTMKVTYDHDGAGEYKEVKITGFNQNKEIKGEFKRDRMNRIEESIVTNLDGSIERVKYTYDSAGRITREEFFLPQGQPVTSLSNYYIYDGDNVIRELTTERWDPTASRIESLSYIFKRQGYGDIVAIEPKVVL